MEGWRGGHCCTGEDDSLAAMVKGVDTWPPLRASYAGDRWLVW
jgi:hypothetical protein